MSKQNFGEFQLSSFHKAKNYGNFSNVKIMFKKEEDNICK